MLQPDPELINPSAFVVGLNSHQEIQLKHRVINLQNFLCKFNLIPDRFRKVDYPRRKLWQLMNVQHVE